MNDVKTPVTYFINQTSVDVITTIANKLQVSESEALETLVGELVNQTLQSSRPSPTGLDDDAGEENETTSLEQRLTRIEDQLLALDDLNKLDKILERVSRIHEITNHTGSEVSWLYEFLG